MGIDSLAAAELLADLEVELGAELDPTVVFSFESPSELAAFLGTGATRVDRAAVSTRPGHTGGADSARSAGQGHEPIAIVGMGCRFPGADALVSAVDEPALQPGDEVAADAGPYTTGGEAGEP